MKWNRFLLYLVLALGVLMAVYPFVWMVGTAFKTLPEANTASLRLFPDTWQWGNVAATFRAAPFGRYFLNSLLVSMIVCVSVCLTSLMAGYAFARLRFRGRGVLFVITLCSMMVPFEAVFVPNFVLITRLGWYNSYFALIVPWRDRIFHIPHAPGLSEPSTGLL